MQESDDAQGLAAMLQVGVAKEQQPHYMRVMALPDQDTTDLLTTITVYGFAPTDPPGDRLTFDLTGLINPRLAIAGENAGRWRADNAADVAYVSIESIDTIPAGAGYGLGFHAKTESGGACWYALIGIRDSGAIDIIEKGTTEPDTGTVYESALPDGTGADGVEREPRAVPVAACAHLFELVDDAALVFVLPGPDPLDQPLAAQLVASSLLLG